MHLVLIETSGNQRYIFATNKLRENVGASELTYGVGTELTLKAVESVIQRPLYDDDILRLHHNLEYGPRLQNGSTIEVIMATSGKALLLVDTFETGRHIVHQVTAEALQKMPGLTVHGTISPPLSEHLQAVHDGIRIVHEELERVRYDMPSVEQRFLRLPFAEECMTSGLPATQYDEKQPEPGPRSAVAMAKRAEANSGRWRMENAVHAVAPDVRLAKSVETLEQRFQQFDWLAVIHADGNGLGQIFLEFDHHIRQQHPTSTWHDYLDAYRRFSLALDTSTVNAFGAALRALQGRFDREAENARLQSPLDLPVVPLVLGGDDLTVLCDGRYAVRFAHDFLTAFEAETQQDHYSGIISQIAKSAFNVQRLSSCVGIAIVKPHFPFHAAYGLAEALLQSAKTVKERVQHQHNGRATPWPCSALDYHILYDSSGANLERIRSHLWVDKEATRLIGRPYVVTEPGLLGPHCENPWVAPRLWEQLKDRVLAMQPSDNEAEHRVLPNTMLHTLREGLFLGQVQADARMRLVRKRYPFESFTTLLGDRKGDGSLFWPEQHDNKDGHTTGFLDALDLATFWK